MIACAIGRIGKERPAAVPLSYIGVTVALPFSCAVRRLGVGKDKSDRGVAQKSINTNL